MSKTKAVLREVYARRAVILELIHGKPMSSADIAKHVGTKSANIANDLQHMSVQGLVKIIGKVRLRNSLGEIRPVSLWESLSVIDADELEEKASTHRRHSAIKLPDLPKNILLMMGYHHQGEPTGGRIINNEKFRQNHPLRKMDINIGNHWGIMMEASL